MTVNSYSQVQQAYSENRRCSLLLQHRYVYYGQSFVHCGCMCRNWFWSIYLYSQTSGSLLVSQLSVCVGEGRGQTDGAVMRGGSRHWIPGTGLIIAALLPECFEAESTQPGNHILAKHSLSSQKALQTLAFWPSSFLPESSMWQCNPLGAVHRRPPIYKDRALCSLPSNPAPT